MLVQAFLFSRGLLESGKGSRNACVGAKKAHRGETSWIVETSLDRRRDPYLHCNLNPKP